VTRGKTMITCDGCKLPMTRYHPVRKPDGTTVKVCPSCMGAPPARPPRPALALADGGEEAG